MPITTARGFNKTAVLNAISSSSSSGGVTSMAEGVWRGWDELRTVPNGLQSSPRIIVLFTDGAANTFSGTFDVNGSPLVSGLATSDFPKNSPDPDNMTSDTPAFAGMYHPETDTRSPSFVTTQPWNSAYTFTEVPYLPGTSFHAFGCSPGIRTDFPLATATITVNGVPQENVRGLRNWDAVQGAFPADIWNTNNSARNLVEMVANEARSDTGAYRIRIFTVGMGELLRYWTGTIPEQAERIMMRVANDIDSPDYNSAQIEGKYYFAATEADVGPVFQEGSCLAERVLA